MSNFSSETKIGIMVLIGAVILIVVTVVVGDYRLREEGYELKVIFGYIGGLTAKAPVRLAGVDVGQVSSIRLVGDDVQVTLWLKPEAKVRKDSQVNINTMGLLGEKYIEITKGSPTSPYLPSGSVIKGEDPVSVGDLLVEGEDLMKSLGETLRSLNELLGRRETKEQLTRILKNLEELTQNLNELVNSQEGGLRPALKNLNALIAENRGEFRQIIKGLSSMINENREDLRSAVVNFKNATGQLDELTSDNRESIERAVANLEIASLTLKEIALSFDHLLGKIKKGEGTIGELLKDKEVYDNIKVTSNKLKSLIEDLEKNPWKLLAKPKEKDKKKK